ncbi:3-oxoacyl-[acyl-carrier-protein] synthase III C-terminal domain-containing protein [Sorangium sp. So ce281]|uniref:3-oxoacyl-[acyl-carrier-protein] synthase III C-terminal domain-containing protein n=1 Tax=unclassified Sorangium TaxID=2621164 RepID=UPI003F625AE6
MTSIYLGSIAHVLGESRSISDLDELKDDEDGLGTLQAVGLETYAVSSRSPAELARESLARTIEKSGLDPKDIGAVLYASSSFWSQEFYTRHIGELCCSLGLEHAVTLGTTLGECGNFASALRSAYGLIRSGDCRTVLLVTTDRAAGKRLVDPLVSVLSDGAASCIVSSERQGELEILGVRQGANQKLWMVDNAKESVKRLKYTADGVKLTITQLLADTGLNAHQIKAFITNNYSYSVLRVFSAQAGVRPGALYLKNVGRVAHAFSADNLIGLQDALEQGDLKSGEFALTLSTGQASWGASILKVA